MPLENTEHTHPLGLDAEGFFSAKHDTEGLAGEVFDTGSTMKLMELEYAPRSETWWARIRPKHHEDEDGFLVKLDDLI